MELKVIGANSPQRPKSVKTEIWSFYILHFGGMARSVRDGCYGSTRTQVNAKTKNANIGEVTYGRLV